MAKRHRRTEEDGILNTHFADQIEDMQVLIQEALERAQARAKAVQERIKADRERTEKKPFWKRTKEEKNHFNRIVEAEKKLDQTDGE